MIRRLLAPLLVLALLLVLVTGAAADPATVTVDRVLRLGPVPLALPAFHDADTHGVTLAELAKVPTLDVPALRPRAGQDVPAPGGNRDWRAIETPLELEGADTPSEVWFAVYLNSDRWHEATLALDLPDSLHLQGWLEGQAMSFEQGDEDGRRAELDLPVGNHLLVVRVVTPVAPDATWSLAPTLTLGDDVPATALATTTDSRRPADIDLVLDAPRVRQAVISPDGELIALRLTARPAGGDAEHWLEIRESDGGELVTTWRAGEARNLAWSPDGERLSFTLKDDDTTDLWLYDVATGATTRLLRGVADMGGYQWAPSGAFVVYSVEVEAEKDERKVKRVRNPADRQPWYRDRSFLVQAAVPSGVTRRLTAGEVSPQNWSISPDSERLLFFRERQDIAGGRPYFASELWELDLATHAAERVLAERWIGDASYGPDPDVLLLSGSPSAFDGLGRNLPEGMQANDYGGQLYLYDREAGTASPLTLDLRPDVASAWWSQEDGQVYALCTETQFRHLYRRHPDRADWERLDTGVEYVDAVDFARDARRAVVRGTSVTTPNRVYAVDLARERVQLVLDPGATAWQDVAFGEVTYWQAELPDGEMLDGRVYWPIDHDPGREYPVIVYYYGGTSPVDVRFGGRYPKNVWAGQDYIVYVPQPSGAIGYGQEFAARHVNDWGRRTAWEVIEATRAFLAAHDSADPERVGCIGASYGGFLTMYLTTQTDLFAAAVSHAGISSISSYWGEGLWGYAYGARALADAFPWSHRDLYVEQSALFHADEVTTPLLLVHGASDTNVPVGESDQMFVALKMLGKEVEYVQIEGQDHWIVDHEQRIVWNDTILAFFARHLKDRPAWWDALYPAP
jgi:dipeptidyl aminopeptidase/acylaminoacyl peptidase